MFFTVYSEEGHSSDVILHRNQTNEDFIDFAREWFKTIYKDNITISNVDDDIDTLKDLTCYTMDLNSVKVYTDKNSSLGDITLCSSGDSTSSYWISKSESVSNALDLNQYTTTLGTTYCTPSIEYTRAEAPIIDSIDTIIERFNKENKERKEIDNMNMFSKLNLEFGPVASTVIRLSPFGLAIKTANREWHTYDAVNQKIVDVSDFSFNLGDTPILYKMPVAPDAVAVGDLILHNGTPVYVLDFADASNKSAGFIVIDTDANERKTILPVCNVFNFNFITKVVSLFNFGNGVNIFGAPTADQPFGNIFPLMMMSEMFKDNGKSNDTDFFKMMMMSQMFSGGANPFAQMFGGFNATPAKSPVVTGGPMDA